MTRAVLDTNTLASAAIAGGGTLATLLEAWRTAQFQVIVSPHILAELATTLAKPYFAERLSETARGQYLALVRSRATIVAIVSPVPDVARTRADNLVLATAESAQADFLVTGDLELLTIRQFRDTRILSSREFIELLDQEPHTTR